MQCPQCGNEIQQEEAFCGQCGTPTVARPSLEESSLFGQALANQAAGVGNDPSRDAAAIVPQKRFSPKSQRLTALSTLSQLSPATPSAAAPSEFHQTPTEKMAPVTSMPLPPQSYQPGVAEYGQYRRAASTNYGPIGHIPPPLVTGQKYKQSPGIKPNFSQQKESGTTVILVAGICCAVVLISILGVGILLLTKQQPAIQSDHTNTPVAIHITPTSAGGTPPTPITTNQPDAGFVLCTTECIAKGFSTEYPSTWQIGESGTATSVQFTNPLQPNQFIALKALGPTTSAAGDLITNDLQTNFATKPGFMPPTTGSTATINGETWVLVTISYQSPDNQPAHVAIYATIYKGNGYIIEAQAPAAQFDGVNAQYFMNILNRFQFV